MRTIGAFAAKTNLSTLLEEVSRGETILITKRGTPVARLVPPSTPDRARATEAREALRRLRRRVGRSTAAEILAMRDEGRRG